MNTNTLKGHGLNYYKWQCKKLQPLIVEIAANRQAYSKKYIEQIQEVYEKNRAVCLAYDILNG